MSGRSPRRADFDVVVVGGGMVGACLAALIAADERLAGWRVALLDPADPQPPRDDRLDLRVSALSRASERILAAAGAWGGIRPHASAYSDMVVWDAASRHDARDALHFSAAETGEPNLGWIVENARVQWALHDAPALRGTVTRLKGQLAGLDTAGPPLRVELDDGRRLSCELVVGADGSASRTRELAGIGRGGFAYRQTAIVGHLHTERPHRETAWQRFLPTGPIAFLPLRDGRVSLVWTVREQDAPELLGLDAARFAQRVGEASDHVLGEPSLDSERAGFPLGLWTAGDYCRPGLALVGDAAHVVHPLAGQGVNLGFLDCASLVEVLGSAVEHDEDPSGLNVLRRYERWRRSENSLVLGLTDGLNRLFGDHGLAVAALRRFGMGLVGAAPPLRRALVERALGLSGELPPLARPLAGTTP